LEVKVNKKNSYEVEIMVEVPRQRWEEMLSLAFENFRRQAKIDGFRPGKIPMPLVKKMFGTNIEADTADAAVKQFYQEAIEQEKIEVVHPGQVLEVDYKDDKPFTFKVLVEVMPELAVEGLDNMMTYLEEVEIGDEEIEKGMENLREERAIMTSVDATIENGNLVVVDLQQVDATGIPILTHNTKNVMIEIGKNELGPNIDKQLLGKNKSEKVLVTVATNAKSENGEIKNLYYQFDIKDILKKELPKIDVDFAQSINPQFKNMEDLRKGIKSYIQEQANRQAKKQLIERLIEHLVDNNRVDVPPSMRETYFDKIYEKFQKNGEKLEKTEFEKEYGQDVLRNLKWFIIRKNLIDQFNLKPMEADFEESIVSMAETSNKAIETIRENYKIKKNREKLSELIEDRKIREFLESKAKVTTRKVSYNEFTQQKRRSPGLYE
jgi:trigger factor